MDLNYDYAVSRQDQLIAGAERRVARASTGRRTRRLRTIMARLVKPAPAPVGTPCVTC